MNKSEQINKLILNISQSLEYAADCIIQEKTNAASYLMGYLKKELEQLFALIQEEINKPQEN